MELPQIQINDSIAEERDTFFDKHYSRNAGVPERFLDATFENTENRTTSKIKSFTQLGRGVMILMGTNGTGKSRTACCAINWRIANGLSAGNYISCNYQVCPLIRSSRSFRAEKNELQVLTEFYTTPFLVLDEVGKGDDSVISKMFVACVLAARYDNNLPTLITTNLNKQELSEFVGKDIQSRFFETAQIAILDGEDFRKGN